MQRWPYALATACVVIVSRTAVGQTSPGLGTVGGVIVNRRPCDAAPTYDRAVAAAAIKVHSTDYQDWFAARPDMDTLFRTIVPCFERDREAALARRSAVAWAEDLHVPLLILQGTADDRVPAGEALRLAERLQALGKEYELLMYSGDTHGLPAHATDAQDRVLRWFRLHVR